jgi:hypothetical protein
MKFDCGKPPLSSLSESFCSMNEGRNIFLESFPIQQGQLLVSPRIDSNFSGTSLQLSESSRWTGKLLLEMLPFSLLSDKENSFFNKLTSSIWLLQQLTIANTSYPLVAFESCTMMKNNGYTKSLLLTVFFRLVAFVPVNSKCNARRAFAK